jgi:SEC-C motif-containing protein
MQCPCGSGLAYETCCAPFLAGAEPPDAPSLMRSRYTAFVRGDHAHLVRTLHPDHEDRRQLTPKALRERLDKHAKRARYHGLVVLDHDGPDADGIHRVLFQVSMKLAGADASFAELSSFAVAEGGIRYLTGRLLDPRELDRANVNRIADLDRLG